MSIVRMSEQKGIKLHFARKKKKAKLIAYYFYSQDFPYVVALGKLSIIVRHSERVRYCLTALASEEQIIFIRRTTLLSLVVVISQF